MVVVVVVVVGGVVVVVVVPEELVYVIPGADGLVDLVEFVKCELLGIKHIALIFPTDLRCRIDF